MSWTLSRYRAGDWIEVRSREEILATLDADGCIDGMPFMPEMLQYCGQQFRVAAVAHKSCDTAKKTWTGRRLDATVHLSGLRCDGSAHGGCQADCNLFWKDAWLKPASTPACTQGAALSTLGAAAECSHHPDGHGHSTQGAQSCTLGASPCTPGASACTEERLVALTQLSTGGETRWSCQATQHFDATAPLAWWDVRQYLRDVVTRNHTVGHVLRILWLALIRQLFQRPWIGYRFFRSLRANLHRAMTGRDVPDVHGVIPRGSPTPTGRLNLRPGEYVRIKSKKEIEKTINEEGNNRGLSFDQEMVRFCGRVFMVRSVVTQIIDEPTGKMIQMKQPCITLQGVVCGSEFSACRLMCPREIPSYWRELWLERVETPHHMNPDAAPVEEFAVGSGSAP